jgi:two-component system, OmpR family, KDP operon response regulator KdpE
MTIPTTPTIKILVIDDEPQIRRLLRITLETVGWSVFEAEDGVNGMSEAAYLRPDCVILDLGLPGVGGVDVLKRLREWSQTPVLILSVRDEAGEKVEALEAGADDYVTKPFESSELVARCRAIMRRRENRAEAPVFSHGALTMDYMARTVKVGGAEMDLTATEYDLLKLFCLNAGRVLTHAYILRAIWGPKSEEQRQYLRVYVAALRRKLGRAVPIQTEPGIGYRLPMD